MKNLIVCIGICLFVSLSFGTTRRVPAQYSTISAAMNAASSGDSIIVAAGTYNEKVIYKANGIKLIGEGADVTTINGGGGVTISTSVSGLDTSTWLYGFKVTGGTGGYDGEGGGLRMWNQQLTVKNCIFTGNTANEGGGLYLERSSSLIESCLIYGNTAEQRQSTGGTGGGVYTFSDFGPYDPVVRYNTIINNDAQGNGNFIMGGGAIAFQKTNGVAIGNLIENNKAKYGNGGIAVMFASGSSPVVAISNNVIRNNDSVGVEVRYAGAADIHINYNQIVGHQYGVRYTYWTSGVLDATNNWWGAASGPYHPVLNPSGTGDEVKDTVKSAVHSINFNPWLTDTSLVAVEERAKLSELPYKLSRCWPNPFLHKTSVRLETKFWVLVSAVVYDVTGREVKCIMRESPKRAGVYEISWDGKDAMGRAVSPGMYFFRMKVNNTSKTVKVVMLER